MGEYRVRDRVSVAGLPGRVDYINSNRDLIDIIFDGQGSATEYIPTSIVVKLASPLKVGDKLTGSDNPEPPVGTLLQFDNQNEIASRRDAGWYHVNQGPHPWRVIDHGRRTVIHLPES